MVVALLRTLVAHPMRAGCAMSDDPLTDAAPLGVVVVDDGWQVVAHVTGEADDASVDRLHESLGLYLVPGQRVMLDLSGVTFMDTSCLGVLERAHQTLAASGGSLILRNPSRTAHRLLTASRMDTQFAIDIV